MIALARKNNKTQVIDYDNSIEKSNSLCMAKLNRGLTLNQMQLLAFAIYSTQKDGKTEFHKVDFERKFDIQNYQTSHAREDVKVVIDLKFSIEELEDDKFEFYNVFQSIKYKKGIFCFKWTEEMIPHILELKDNYVVTDLTITSKFKSGFSWTLYEYLKSHYGYWHKNVSKEALMRLFNVEDRVTYQRNTARFKATVLETAIEELNEHTELKVWYVEKREGRSIIGFDLHWSTGKKVPAASTAQIEEIKTTLNAIEKDSLEYVANIKDEEERKEAMTIIRKAIDMKNEMNDDKNITSKNAEILYIHAKQSLNRLEALRNKKRIPFYNWLEERA